MSCLIFTTFTYTIALSHKAYRRTRCYQPINFAWTSRLISSFINIDYSHPMHFTLAFASIKGPRQRENKINTISLADRFRCQIPPRAQLTYPSWTQLNSPARTPMESWIPQVKPYPDQPSSHPTLSPKAMSKEL